MCSRNAADEVFQKTRRVALYYTAKRFYSAARVKKRKEKKRKEKKRKEKLLIKKQSWSEYSSVRSFFLQIDQCVSFQYLCSEQSEVHSQTCFLSLILHKESNLKYSCDINSHRSDIFKDK